MLRQYKQKAEKYASTLKESGISGLRSVVVFGSCATGKVRQNSDIDIVVLLDSDKIQDSAVETVRLITMQDEFRDTPRLAVNVESVKNFFDHLAKGDPFAVSIALEGYCLLNSDAFSGLQSVVGKNTNPPEPKSVSKYLEQKSSLKALEIIQFHIPALLEAIYVAVSSSLLKSHLCTTGITDWSDLCAMDDKTLIVEAARMYMPNHAKSIKRVLQLRKQQGCTESLMESLNISEIVLLAKKLMEESQSVAS